VTGGVGGTGEGSVDGGEATDIKEELSIKVEDPLEIKENVSITVEEAIDIKEELGIKVEEAIHIKEEIPEAIVFPAIKTEHEVRLWGVS
jgi:Xaa-Pro aminopeptidase